MKSFKEQGMQHFRRNPASEMLSLWRIAEYDNQSSWARTFSSVERKFWEKAVNG